VAVEVVVAVPTAVPVVTGGTGVGAAPASTAMGPLLTAVGGFESTHFQIEGQSVSVVQLAALAWQEPGNEVVVTHTGAEVPASDTGKGGGAGGAPEPLPPPVPDEEPDDDEPLPAEPDPEHHPIVVGWQTKPVPQSASALQGKSHMYRQSEVVVSVQTGSVAGGAVVQTVLGSHLTATAVPPLHVVVVSLWQTMAWPQSALVWQGAGRQVREGAGGVVVGRQVVPVGHAGVGVGVAALAWQVRPCAQSLLLAQVCALANFGMARTVTSAVIHKSCFVGVMTSSFDLGWLIPQ